MVDPVNGHGAYRGWISIPYLTPAGPVAMKFRRLDNTEPKYLGPPGQKVHLYNVMALHKDTDEIVICEGELDALVMDAIVGYPAVGVAGVNNWADHFGRVLEGYDRILIMVDNDLKEDGSNPGRELQSRLLQELPQSIPVELPMGFDVNQMVLERGVSAVRELITVGAL